jgi:hypothetical protein
MEPALCAGGTKTNLDPLLGISTGQEMLRQASQRPRMPGRRRWNRPYGWLQGGSQGKVEFPSLGLAGYLSDQRGMTWITEAPQSLSRVGLCCRKPGS